MTLRLAMSKPSALVGLTLEEIQLPTPSMSRALPSQAEVWLISAEEGWMSGVYECVCARLCVCVCVRVGELRILFIPVKIEFTQRFFHDGGPSMIVTYHVPTGLF